jgi:hypothetical protein
MLHHRALEAAAAGALQCRRCRLPSPITDRFTLNGAPGRVEHAQVVCAVGHWFARPIESLPPQLHPFRSVDATRMPTPTTG